MNCLILTGICRKCRETLKLESVVDKMQHEDRLDFESIGREFSLLPVPDEDDDMTNMSREMGNLTLVGLTIYDYEDPTYLM